MSIIKFTNTRKRNAVDFLAMEQVIDAIIPCFTQLKGSSHTQDWVSQIVTVVHECELRQSCSVHMEPIQGQESFLAG